jgi:pilus assembly protein FimV
MEGTRMASALLAALLAGHAGAAQALEIDRITIRSRLGEPLRAEIPVTGTAEELQALQAQLAAPVTFARIGLPRPQGVVADLRFNVVRAPGGGAVIRVSSATPVDEDFLTFLIQLDWGGGRMVREYSVALSTEDSMAASVPPPVQSAVAAPSNQIARAPDTAAVELPVEEVAPVPLAGSAAASPPAVAPIPLAAAAPKRTDDVPARAPASASKAAAKSAAKPAPTPAATPEPKPTPAADPVPVARTALAPSKPAPAAIPPATPATAESIPVEAGDTLTAIASRLDRDDNTLEQMMLALLRANPDAFTRGNINLLRRGVMLRMPHAEALSHYDAAQAAAVVAEQIRQWRDGVMPAMHPAALAEEAPPPASRATPAAEAPRVAPPRLEIAPAEVQSVATSFVGAQSGIASAGDSRELRMDAPTDAAKPIAPAVQVEQMQARIAELEALQRDQQKLIALQNSELAARGQSGGWSWAWLAALAAVFASGWALARWWNGKRLARSAASAESQHARPAWHDGGNEKPEPV